MTGRIQTSALYKTCTYVASYTHWKPEVGKMSVFTRDEIAFFREQYANQLRPNARGVDQDGFVKAISASVAHAGLGNPGVDQFVVSFNKIKNRDGVVAWPQFFQVITIH